MKKIISSVLLTTGLLMSLGNASAAEITCPSPEQIKSVSFTEGRPFFPAEDKWFWMVNSGAFIHENTEWNLWLAALLSVTEQDQAAAVQEAQKLLATLTLNPAKPDIKDDGVACEYKTSDDNVGLIAVNPPFSMPSFSHAKFLRK